MLGYCVQDRCVEQILDVVTRDRQRAVAFARHVAAVDHHARHCDLLTLWGLLTTFRNSFERGAQILVLIRPWR
jgi:hypothetical protein